MSASVGYFLPRRLRNKSRARQATGRCSFIDLIDKTFVERNIDTNRPARISQQWNGEQQSTRFNSCLNVSVTQNNFYVARSGHRSASTFQRFHVLTQCRRGVCYGFIQRISGRKAAFHVRKPDAKGTIGFLFDDRNVMHRHQLDSSRSPSGQLIDPSHEASWQISARMRHRDDHVPFRMFKGVMITAHAVKHPTILLQHPDQLAAIPLHSPSPTFFTKSCEADAAGIPPRPVHSRRCLV